MFPTLSELRLLNFMVGGIIVSSAVCLGMNVVTAGSDQEAGEKMLYDFRKLPTVEKWMESSDTVRTPGMSKGSFVLQKSQLFQRVVFFSMLNPQPNGAGFVGFYTYDQLDLKGFSAIEMKVRGQGKNSVYKLTFKHKNHTIDDGSVSYQSFFEIPIGVWTSVSVPLNSFKAYFRGRIQPDAEPLDLAKVSLIGIQIVGGVYSDFKQSGTSSLEIDYIKAV